MGTVLFNPTNEELKAQHQGVDVIIPAYPAKGHMVEVDDRRARHILNILGPRGLTTLIYGDEGDKKEKKAKSGVERNKVFKRKQVVDFNQLNLSNKHSNKDYLYPGKQLKEYADEIGIKLEEPYSVPDEGREKVSALMDEVKTKDTTIKNQGKQLGELQKQVSGLSSQLASLLEMMKQPEKAEPVVELSKEQKEAGEYLEEVVKFRSLNKAQFTAWMKRNWDEIPTYPVEIQAEVKERHDNLFKKPFPESKPE